MPDGGIVLFGGSFNPIHNGHLIVARAAAERLRVSRVVFVPSPSPPHKTGTGLADAADRLAMVRLAIAGEPLFDCSDIETRRAGPSYTILTVEDYRRTQADRELFWLIGADSLADLHSWHRVAELVDACRIVTAARPGFETPDLSSLERVLRPEHVRRIEADILPTPRIDISATEIRRRVAEGRSIRYLLPEPVADYLVRRGLYRGFSPDPNQACPRSRPCG